MTMRSSFLIDCGGLNNWVIQIGDRFVSNRDWLIIDEPGRILRKEERMNRLAHEKEKDVEIKFDQTPRADFAKVKESLTGYGTLYPQSPYVPEAHYLISPNL